MPGSDDPTRPWRWLFVTQAREPSTRWTLPLLLASCICLFRGKKAWGFARTKLSPNVQSKITHIPRNSYKKYVSRSIEKKRFDKPPSDANSPRSVLVSIHCCWVCGSEPKGTIWGYNFVLHASHFFFFVGCIKNVLCSRYMCKTCYKLESRNLKDGTPMRAQVTQDDWQLSASGQ